MTQPQPHFHHSSDSFEDDSFGIEPLFHPLESGSLQLMSAEVCLQRGNRHYAAYLSHHQSSDLNQAMTHYKQALELNPSLPEAYVKLGTVLWEQGGMSVEVALDYCEIALKLNPDCGEAYLRKGTLLHQAGQLDEAISNLKLAIAKNPIQKQAQARLAFGSALMSAALKHSTGHSPMSWPKRIQNASSGLLQWAQGALLLPGDKSACQLLWTSLQSDLSIVAVTAFGRLLKTVGFNAAVSSLYGWAITKMPREAIFPHLLGDLHTDRLDFEEAIHCYQMAEALEPDNALLNKKLGLSHYQRHETDEAAHHLEKVLDSGSCDSEARYNLAQIYTEQADYMRALYHYKELMVESPNNPYLHSNMAYVLFRLEDYDGAIASYQFTVEHGTDPVWTSTVAHTLGTIYYQVKHNLDAAERMLHIAYRLDSSNLECLTLLGDILTEQGRFEEAVQMYRRLLEVEPDNADCCNYMGYLLWQLDRHEEAIDFYQRAITLEANNPIAYNNLGVIFLDEKCAPNAAFELFNKAVTLKEDYTLAHFNVARTLEALGQTTKAAKGYSDALKWNQENPELNDTEIQERLTRLFEV